MVSGEELSSNSICLKMPVHSLEALELVNCHHEKFRCEYTILCLLFAEKAITLTQHKLQSLTWFFGSYHIIGIPKGIAVFLLFIQSHNEFEHDVDITWGAQSLFWSNGQPKYNWYNFWRSDVIVCHLAVIVKEPYIQQNVSGWSIHFWGVMVFSY
jgi:hypothetical protein